MLHVENCYCEDVEAAKEEEDDILVNIYNPLPPPKLSLASLFFNS